MGIRFPLVKCSLAAFLAIVLFSLPGFAQSEKLDELFQQLRTPGLQNYDLVESEIWTEWSKSGSPDTFQPGYSTHRCVVLQTGMR
jgi:hypothetical protein